MTSTSTPGPRVLGTLRRADGGTGIVRLQDRFPTDVDDLWSALTDPARLVRWLGDCKGELREGGEFRAHFFASGWEGTCRIEECEPKRRIVVATHAEDGDGTFVVTLAPDGEETLLTVEDHGVPLDHIADYGAGDQIHVEDLAAFLAGRGPCDARARWAELAPAYRAQGLENG